MTADMKIVEQHSNECVAFVDVPDQKVIDVQSSNPQSLSDTPASSNAPTPKVDSPDTPKVESPVKADTPKVDTPKEATPGSAKNDTAADTPGSAKSAKSPDSTKSADVQVPGPRKRKFEGPLPLPLKPGRIRQHVPPPPVMAKRIKGVNAPAPANVAPKSPLPPAAAPPPPPPPPPPLPDNKFKVGGFGNGQAVALGAGVRNSRPGMLPVQSYERPPMPKTPVRLHESLSSSPILGTTVVCDAIKSKSPGKVAAPWQVPASSPQQNGRIDLEFKAGTISQQFGGNTPPSHRSNASNSPNGLLQNVRTPNMNRRQSTTSIHSVGSPHQNVMSPPGQKRGSILSPNANLALLQKLEATPGRADSPWRNASKPPHHAWETSTTASSSRSHQMSLTPSAWTPLQTPPLPPTN
jgi:hypothetical protein